MYFTDVGFFFHKKEFVVFGDMEIKIKKFSNKKKNTEKRIKKKNNQLNIIKEKKIGTFI